MKLYYSPGACSLAPHIALCEAGLPFEAVPVNLRKHTLRDGTDYRTISPNGYVPLLQLDNGQTLAEGPAIVQYIADQAPDKHLAPPNGTWERYKLQERLNFITTELHKGFAPLFNPGASDDTKAQARTKLLDRFSWVNEQLASQPYLVGSTFTVADAYLFTVCGWGRLVGVDLSVFPHLVDFATRVGDRAAVKEALHAEGLHKHGIKV